MVEYDSMVARQRKWMLYLLLGFVILFFVFPYPRIANGLLLGGVLSYYNLWLLQRKVNQVGEKVAKGEESRTGLGTFSRMAAAILGTLIVIQYEEHFNLFAMVAGLMSSYLVIGIDGIVQIISQRESKKH